MIYLELLFANHSDTDGEKFRLFFTGFIGNYQYQSVTFLEFRLFFNSYVQSTFPSTDAAQIIAAVDWDAWIKKGGQNPF